MRLFDYGSRRHVFLGMKTPGSGAFFIMLAVIAVFVGGLAWGCSGG